MKIDKVLGVTAAVLLLSLAIVVLSYSTRKYGYPEDDKLKDSI